MSATKVKILSQSESAARLKRIAFEIYEQKLSGKKTHHPWH